MAERSNVLLAGLLAAASALAALVLSGLLALGWESLTALALGVVSACLVLLTGLAVIPLPALALVVLAAASGLAFLRSLVGYVRARRLLRALPVERLARGELAEVAREVGLRDLLVVPASRPDAFCFGLLRPRVVVTTAFLGRLRPEEQAAALWHEAHHARLREPLRSFSARLAADTFFWLPAFREVLERYLLVKELEADHVGASRTSARALAGALFHVAEGATPAGAVGLAEFAAARVDRLFDPAAKLPPLFRAPRLLASSIVIAGLLLLVALAGQVAVAEPAHLWAMLTSLSPHGLPGMAVGLVLNLIVLVLGAAAVQRLLR